MNMKEFILEKYDVRERISKLASIYRQDGDGLDSRYYPYDEKEVIDGVMTKVLRFGKGQRTIAVYDLLMYTDEEMLTYPDMELAELYFSYMKLLEAHNS